MTQNRALRLVIFLIVAVTLVLGTTVVTAQQQEAEPNGEEETATPISIGETVTGEIGTEGDDDMFSFQATKGQTITITGMDKGDLEKDEGIDMSFDNGGGAGIREANGEDVGSITTTENGTYYIEVDATQSFTGSYEFVLTSRNEEGPPTATPTTAPTATSTATLTMTDTSVVIETSTLTSSETNERTLEDLGSEKRPITSTQPDNGGSGVDGPGFGFQVALLAVALLTLAGIKLGG